MKLCTILISVNCGGWETSSPWEWDMVEWRIRVFANLAFFTTFVLKPRITNKTNENESKVDKQSFNYLINMRLLARDDIDMGIPIWECR